MSDENIPCHNCITLAICLNKLYNPRTGFHIFDVSKKCVLLEKYFDDVTYDKYNYTRLVKYIQSYRNILNKKVHNGKQ